jgi:hypothetical protein
MEQKKTELGLGFEFGVEPKFGFFSFCSIPAFFSTERNLDGTKKS